MAATYCNPEEVVRSVEGCLNCPRPLCQQACPNGVDLVGAVQLLKDWVREAQRRDPDAYIKEAINAWYAH